MGLNYSYTPVLIEKSWVVLWFAFGSWCDVLQGGVMWCGVRQCGMVWLWSWCECDCECECECGCGCGGGNSHSKKVPYGEIDRLFK